MKGTSNLEASCGGVTEKVCALSVSVPPRKATKASWDDSSSFFFSSLHSF